MIGSFYDADTMNKTQAGLHRSPNISGKARVAAFESVDVTMCYSTPVLPKLKSQGLHHIQQALEIAKEVRKQWQSNY